jgi:hypothetical protein
MKQKNIIQRVILSLFALMLVAPTWADDVTLQDDNGTKYVNMPSQDENTLTIPQGVTTFKVYDDGGKDGNYGADCSGILVLKAPAGYNLQLSGNITTQSYNDYLIVFDSSGTDGTTLLNTTSNSSGVQTVISTVSSSGPSMTLYFSSDDSYHYAGLDLTVEVVASSSHEDGGFKIASKEDWKQFCQLVNEGQTTINAKLMADIDLGTDISTVGTDVNKYSGTFDGQGHSITVNWYTNYSKIALFSYLNAATISNLCTQGNITSTGYSVKISGMVGEVYGHVKLTNCSSMVNLTATHNSERSAGMVAFTANSSYTEITDCVVGRNISGDRNNHCGFIFYQGGWCVLTNCLYIGEDLSGIAGYSYTFVMNGKGAINNCYYLNPCGWAQGEEIDEMQLANGEVIAKLGSAWAQKFGEMPSPFNESKKDEDNYVYYDTARKQWTCNYFNLSTHPELPIGIDFIASHIKEGRIFTETDQACTMCLPYDLPINGFKAYTLSGSNGTTLRFKEVKDQLEAYHPYYIVLSGLQKTNRENTLVKAYNDEAMESTEGDYTFAGTVFKINNTEAAFESAYILQSDNLWHKVLSGNDAVNIPAYRAYITLSPSVEAKTLSISLDDGAVTGISAIETTDQDGTVRYYDLNGRYIGNTLNGQYHGIYIKNGKKIINK